MKKHASCLVLLVAAVPFVIRGWTWLTPPDDPVDPRMADQGKSLFVHEWTVNDPLSQGGDGLGPVFNATSCVACHRQSGIGGGGPLENNVTAFTVRPDITSGVQTQESIKQGVVHAFAISGDFQETLQHVHPSLPSISKPRLGDIQFDPTCLTGPMSFPRGVSVTLRNTPALFGAAMIDAIPERVIIVNARRQKLKWAMASSEVEHAPVGRALRLPNGDVGKFGWKFQTASLLGFVQGACANELGLGNPGAEQPASMRDGKYKPPGLDLSTEQCLQLTSFVAALPRPFQQWPADERECQQIRRGEKLFESVGCADCHLPNCAGIDGLYSDLLLHRMGPELQGGGSYGESFEDFPDLAIDQAHPSEWRTPPLWGVADSAPYLHDGRAMTLRAAILEHGGQADASRKRFEALEFSEQHSVICFLESLRAPASVEKANLGGAEE